MLLGVALFLVWVVARAWLNRRSKEPIGRDSGSSASQRLVPDAEYCKSFPFDERCPKTIYAEPGPGDPGWSANQDAASSSANQGAASAAKSPEQVTDKEKRKQALAYAFEEGMRQQGYEVSVGVVSNQLWYDCSTALDPRSACYFAYQSAKYLPSKLKAELRSDGITTLNFSPNGGMIPTWAINTK
jgi:hypothetical protein